MGFMNALNFSAACFDLLGWPLFALGYPLCASIWAIETNSIADIKKLVSYWVLFSLISLFDHAFSKLLEWVPFWPYLKLMVICSLVIPHFDGAYYVYQHLVHPCLSMDPQVVMNWFLNESKKSFHGGENFLIAADLYVKENGAEALEKLLNSKSTKPKTVAKEIKAPAEPEVKGEQWKCEDPTVAQKKIQVVQPTQIKDSQDGGTRCEAPDAAKKEIRLTEVTHTTFDAAVPWGKPTNSTILPQLLQTTPIQVDDVGLSLVETRRDTTCAAQIKKSPTSLAAAEIEACGDHHRTPEIPLHKEIQKEWACAMCLVTTQSEATFNSHLRGKRHKATSEVLKAKTNGSQSASTSKKSSHSTKEELPKCTSGNLKSKMNGTSAASTVVKKQDNTKDSKQHMCKSGNRPNQDNNIKHEEKPQGDQKKSKKETSNEPKELGKCCNICNVTCTSVQNMASHLNGKKHLNGLMELSQLWCSTCNVKCLSEVDMASHRNGKKHLNRLMELSPLWCSTCNVKCLSEVDMASHLNGKKHLNMLMELSQLWCSTCNVKCLSEVDMASHKNGKKHLEQLKKCEKPLGAAQK